ncbi:MAG: protein translocase subunit SecD [Chloroflexota bacterium]|nr:protein translocase subunit SecD [Chloroflexota bacterium]
MRRYIRSLILVIAVVSISALIVGFQKISIGDIQRGDDTVLGMRLGLDLQGGSHLVYEAIDRETGLPIVPEPSQMEALQRSISNRVNASGIGEPNIQILGDSRLLVQLPGVRDPARAKSLIGQTAQLVFKHRQISVARPLDELKPETQVVDISAGQLLGDALESDENSNSTSTTTDDQDPPFLFVEFTDQGTLEFMKVVDRMMASVSHAITASLVPNTLEISINGDQPLKFVATPFTVQRVENTNRFAFPFPFPDTGEEGRTGSLDEALSLLGDKPTIDLVEIQSFVDKTPEYGNLTGDDLARAYPDQHAQSGAPIVVLEFKSRGTRIWGQLTGDLAGKGSTDRIAIFLDDTELIAPSVTTPITTGTTIIQGGSFTLEFAQDLALQLESGALPLSIQLLQERDVDAILGADSLRKSVIAGLVGLGLVLLFMVLYYRVPGLIASIALVVYSVIVLALFKAIPITLTLSGVAAVILSIGIAVDANILIFERMKEELRMGRTLLSAINIGFNRAWPAIRDGNVSTLITCAILYYFANQLGTTVVQGFAVALSIGVIVSLFTAITVSRTFLRVIATTRISRRLEIFVPAGGADLPQTQANETPGPGS